MKNRKVIQFERAVIFWLNTHEFLPAKPVAGAKCRPLNAEDIQRLSRIKDFDIDDRLAADFSNSGFVGIGIFVDKKLAGLSLFCAERVPARYNRQSAQTNGVSVELPPGTRYLFKAIVLPQFRGQRLHSAVVRYAIDHFGKDTVHTIVTSCDVSNKAYTASTLDQGFERVGKTLELCITGKSLYKLPKPIDSLSGAASKDADEDGCIVWPKRVLG